MPDFIPGLELSRLFYEEAVKPILDADFPDLRYDAALIGFGSEVLGFDTRHVARSQLGTAPAPVSVSATIWRVRSPPSIKALRRGLPYQFRGYPTSFVPIPGENSRALEERSEGEVDHFVTIVDRLLTPCAAIWISTLTPRSRPPTG